MTDMTTRQRMEEVELIISTKKKMFIEDIRPTKFFNKEVKVDEMYYHHVTLALFS